MAAYQIREISDREFSSIRELVYSKIGVNLTEKKIPLIRSRLNRRLTELGFSDYSRYFKYLEREDPGGDELRCMVNAITTNTTEFFRESYHFDFIRERLVPELKARIEKHRGMKRVRIWSAASSSGEEVYSIAITMLENLGPEWDIRILGSDVDTNALEKAKRGVYVRAQLKHVSEPLLKKYFLKGKGDADHLVKVKNTLRNVIQWQQINLISEDFPIKAELDAIFCRNVFIYFDDVIREKILRSFYKQLKPGKYLFVGHSESLLKYETLFRLIGKTIYQRV